MAGASLAKRITEMAETNRSHAYRWLKANYAEIAQVIPVRGSWKAIRAAAIEAGVKVDVGGVKADPTVQALRSAWRRVQADKAATKGDPGAKQAPHKPPKVTSPSRKPVDLPALTEASQPPSHDEPTEAELWPIPKIRKPT
jgi:hypothetical protein